MNSTIIILTLAQVFNNTLYISSTESIGNSEICIKYIDINNLNYFNDVLCLKWFPMELMTIGSWPIFSYRLAEVDTIILYKIRFTHQMSMKQSTWNLIMGEVDLAITNQRHSKIISTILSPVLTSCFLIIMIILYYIRYYFFYMRNQA